MDRLEMAKELFDNPKLRARGKYIGKIYEVKCKVYSDGSKTIVCIDNYEQALQISYIEGEIWEIIEPKLKEFCFGEVIYYYFKMRADEEGIVSLSSGKSMDGRWIDDLELEECKGKWTIEGYYED